MPARYAIFVDAAFLWASVGELLYGSNDRSRLTCDYEGLVEDLVAATGADAGRELLRTYWYDGAVNKVPTPEQKRIGLLPSVKLRLGRVVSGHQKGVDSLIVLDLLKLSGTGMVDTIYLLSGDDDLTEGVREAQALGVRVSLIGAATALPRHSESLLLEADGVELWGEELWRPHFTRTAPEPYSPSPSSGPRTQTARQAAVSAGPEAVQTFGRVGYAFATRWLDEASDAEVERIMRARPRIPGDLDARLLWDTSAGRDLSEGERVALREGFWRAVDEDTHDADDHDAGDVVDDGHDDGHDADDHADDPADDRDGGPAVVDDVDGPDDDGPADDGAPVGSSAGDGVTSS